jgi:hypothetical protein
VNGRRGELLAPVLPDHADWATVELGPELPGIEKMLVRVGAAVEYVTFEGETETSSTMGR